MMGMNNSRKPWRNFSKSIADLIVYLTPPDYERTLNPPLSAATTESLRTISNLTSLEFEQARVHNEENRQLFTRIFILQPLEQRYLIEQYPIQGVEVSELKMKWSLPNRDNHTRSDYRGSANSIRVPNELKLQLSTILITSHHASPSFLVRSWFAVWEVRARASRSAS
jgi:hypothetical protein